MFQPNNLVCVCFEFMVLFLSGHVKPPPCQLLLLHYLIFVLLFTSWYTKYILCYALDCDASSNYIRIGITFPKKLKEKNTNIPSRVYKTFLLRKHSKQP